MDKSLEKVYHLPDWELPKKGTTLTDYALCGKYVKGEHQWFALSFDVVTCEECIRRYRDQNKEK